MRGARFNLFVVAVSQLLQLLLELVNLFLFELQKSREAFGTNKFRLRVRSRLGRRRRRVGRLIAKLTTSRERRK